MMLFNELETIVRVPTKGAALLVLRRVHDFLSINQTGNNSGPLLLTMYQLTVMAQPQPPTHFSSLWPERFAVKRPAA
jgi:hypothetical protein